MGRISDDHAEAESIELYDAGIEEHEILTDDPTD